MKVEGKCLVFMDDGTFENVLYLPNLSFNLFSIYQITHFRYGKKVEYLLDSIIVNELKDDALVVVGQANKKNGFTHSPTLFLSLLLQP